MDNVIDILKRDIQERIILQEGINQMRKRQISMIIIGIFIFLMFLANYIFLVEQNQKQENIIKAIMEVKRLGDIITTEETKLIDSLPKDSLK